MSVISTTKKQILSESPDILNMHPTKMQANSFYEDWFGNLYLGTCKRI